MITSDGREVDVDLVTDPALGHQVEAFDAWRIRWFLDEAADDGYSHDDIIAACINLSGRGIYTRWLRDAGSRCLTLQGASTSSANVATHHRSKQRARYIYGSAADHAASPGGRPLGSCRTLVASATMSAGHRSRELVSECPQPGWFAYWSGACRRYRDVTHLDGRRGLAEGWDGAASTLHEHDTQGGDVLHQRMEDRVRR